MAERVRKLAVAQLRLAATEELIPHDLVHELSIALDPQREVTRFRKTWRTSRPHLQEKAYLIGKLGFIRKRPSEEVYFDIQEEDFLSRKSATEQGVFSHYVVSVCDALVAFELKKPDIELFSFIGAFSGLLREAKSAYRLEPSTRDVTDFLSWADTQSSIKSFLSDFRRPNPRYRRRTEDVRDYLEESNAQKGTWGAEAVPNEGLRIRGTMLEEAVQHADIDGYGSVKALSVENGIEEYYKDRKVSVVLSIVESTEDSSEKVFERIKGALSDFLKKRQE